MRTKTLLFNGLLLSPFKSVNITEYSPGRTGDFHRHNCYQIIVGLSGMLSLESPSVERLDISPGDVGIIASGKSHSWRASTRPLCKTIQVIHDPLSSEAFGELSSIFGNPDFGWKKAVIDLKETLRIGKSIRNECSRVRTGSSGLVHGNLMNILALALRDIIEKEDVHFNDHSNILIRRSLNYIENHYRESITLDKLSANSYLSPSRFSELFRKFTELSPMRYIYNFRLKKAEMLLIYSEMSVTEVADYLGFQSVHYFSRAFKKHEGCSPTEFITKKCNCKIVQQKQYIL
ncbi:helix-turn-helix domain-containing protein [bacterium]|nr:helix-turn-helix domain-containing protein [bacterium]